MADISDSEVHVSPPPPTSPTNLSPTVAPSPNTPSPKAKGRQSFRSNLQVLLKKQDNELVKNRDYKKKIEEGDEEAEDCKERDENKNESDKVNSPANKKQVKEFKESKRQRKKSTDGKIHSEKEGKEKKRKESLRESKEDKVDAKQDKKNKEPKENPKENNEEKFQHTADKEEETKDLKEEKSKDPEIQPMTESKADEEKSKNEKKEETEEKEAKEKDTATTEEKDKTTSIETKTGSTNGSPNDIGKNVVTEEKKTETKKSELPKMERKSEAQQDILPSSSTLLSPSSNHEKEKNNEGPKGGTANKGDESKPKKHQGILLKKGRSPFSSWKKYYFILDGKLLMYYRSENDFKSLGAAKGSLDLAMLEEIRPKKPGIMKSRFPFCLTRRTLRSINLAALTNDDRERWMSILRGTQQHPNRLSGSENILNSPTSSIPTEEKEKYATMPGLTGGVHSEGSMSSLSEESISESDEEEPVLIQPKKIKLIGPGIPMQDFSAVKLKKVEDPTKKEEKEVATNVKTGDEENEFIEGKMFGVKLKKTVVKGISIESDTTNKEDGPTTEARKDAPVKRPNKQPTIPLNKSSLLSHPDMETNRISPESKQKNRLERKRSPSPSIPLSKGIHAFLTKSADEPEADDTKVSSEVSRVNDVPVCIAETIEIKYNEDLLSLEDTYSVNLVQDEEEKIHSADDDDLNRNENENTELSETEKQNETLEMPQVSISIKENSNEEPEYEEFDEEFLRLMQQNNPANLISSENTTTNSAESSPIPKPSSLKENTESDAKDTSLDLEELVYENIDVETSSKNKPFLNEQSEMPPRSQADKTVVVADKPASIGDEPECEEFDEEFVKNVTAASKPSTTSSSVQVLTIPSGRNADQEDSTTPPRSPFRLRSGTNESSNSSCRSDSENTDKISGKFKIFQSKHSGSSDENKKEEDIKEGKERKKRKSAFSKFLPSMKSKDKKNKGDVEEPKHPQSEDGIPENPEYSKTKSSEPEKALNSETTNVKCVDEEKQKTPEMDIPLISVQGEAVEKEKSMQVDLRQDPPSFIGEARSSTYSCSSTTSKDRDPPPEVPEKRGTRAKSPGYDVPQSNRPVTTMEYSFQQAEEEEEEKQVDGMISQEQINAILTARDNRERRRKSSSRNSGGLLVVPDSSQAVPSGCEVNDDLGSRRPSYFSITSIESDEPLPKTHFLSDRHSCSSGSFKMIVRSDDSDGSSDTQVTPSKAPETPSEQETTVVLRPNRLTECRSGGPRVSLTSPEFTVPEEDAPGSPGPDKAAPATKVENALEDSPSEKELDKPPHQEDDEQNDYFPDVGGGIKLRQHSPSRLLQGPLDASVRTSGIIGLKAYLEENQEEVTVTKSGISRLGHSAAIEKLKRESGEDS